MLGGRRIAAMCTSRLNDLENSRFIMELSRLLTQHDTSLFIYNVNTDLYWNDDNIRAESHVFGLIDYTVTDVVILMHEKIKSQTVTDKVVSEARSHGVPVIVVDSQYDGCISVCYDYRDGFETLVRHVIENHGVRRPHFIGGFKDNPFSEERLEVFRRVVEENGIPFSDSMVSYGNFWAKPARAAAERIVESGDIPEAIICANDIMAINVCSVLTEHGLKVPEDVIVTGFDGFDEIHFSNPRITSSYCGSAGLSNAVYRAVIDAVEDGVTEGSRLVRPTLLLYESCGCCNTGGYFYTQQLRSFNDRFYRYQDDNMLLSVISESMQSCSSVHEAACRMYSEVLQNISVVINRSCTDNTSDFFSDERNRTLGEDMFLFFDSDIPEFRQRSFSRSEVIPDLENVLAKGYPLIFNVISYMNVPLGYICFHFYDYDIMDYCKIPQAVSAVSWGVGGFVNMQYQRYLTSRIENMYRFDYLTGLYNRLSFSREFEERKRSLEGLCVPITVILVDLDGLKLINDSHGHSAGDNAISVTANALRECCPDNALCVRFGGDEMLAVIDGDCDPEGIRADISRRLREYNSGSGLPYEVSASVGVYRTDSESCTDFELLVRESDADMYSEKLAKKRLKGIE